MYILPLTISTVAMKRAFVVVLTVLVCLSESLDPDWVSAYNVIWNTTTADERGSLPLGNGDIASNVWLENKTGDVLFYLAKADAWDVNAQLLKVGRIRLHFDPPLYTSSTSDFRQALDLLRASVNISSEGYEVLLFVDALLPAFRVQAARTDEKSFSVKASLEVWRNDTTPVPKSWVGGQFCKSRFMFPDTVVNTIPFSPDVLLWYHRNYPTNSTFWSDSLTLQGLDSLNGSLHDPLTNVTFGGLIQGVALKRTDPTTLSGSNIQSLDMAVTLLTQQMDSVEDWTMLLAKQTYANPAVTKSYENTAEWWGKFWTQSGVIVDSKTSDDGHVISAQAAYQRFLDACDGRGAYPIKFNGQLFTADDGTNGPDYRDWGGGIWWQNTRQPYYNALASGDLDMLRSFYQFYVKLLPLVQGRTKIYFNHSGGFFPETMTAFGTYDNNGFGYGCSEKANHIASNTYIRYHIVGSLELVFLLLDDFDFTGNKTVAQSYLLPIAQTVLTYYDKHWPNKDSKTGKTVFFPSQSLETWQCPNIPATVSTCVTNPTPDVAGLHAILPRMLQLKSKGINVSDDDQNRWQQMLNDLPDVATTKDAHGNVYIMPGELLPSHESNSENTELYVVHPFRLYAYGMSDADLAVAKLTYANRRHPCNDGWCQDIMDAAILGITDDAMKMVVQRARAAPQSGWRFTGFAAHDQDYEPSVDHLNTMRTALHYMLVQWSSTNNTVYLFPSWPVDAWDVTFRLFAPGNTLIEASCVGGKLTSLIVTPQSRLSDVIVVNCKKSE